MAMHSNFIRAFLLWFFGMTSYLVFMGVFIYTSYEQATNNVFISTDKTAGVCKGEHAWLHNLLWNSTVCNGNIFGGHKRGLEHSTSLQVRQAFVPCTLAFLSHIGFNFVVDIRYTANIYGADLTGLTYTNDKWVQTMDDIQSAVKKLGRKAAQRDYAWYGMYSIKKIVISVSLRHYIRLY